MLDKRQFYIGGEWVEPATQNDLFVLNPATEKPIAVISLGTAVDIDRAVAAAKKAFASYSRTSVEERLALLEKLLAIYKRRYDEMADTITAELGAPKTMSREQQAEVGVGHLQGFIDALKRLKLREKLPNGDTLLREPIGVCGLITPWNWPVNQIALKVVPALATGCTCILKPSEFTPLNAMLYAEMIEEAGFPAGVFNLVNGDGIHAHDFLRGTLRHDDRRQFLSAPAGRLLYAGLRLRQLCPLPLGLLRRCAWLFADVGDHGRPVLRRVGAALHLSAHAHGLAKSLSSG